MADAVVRLVVATRPVPVKPSVQVTKGVLAEPSDCPWGELQPPLDLFNQPSLGEHSRQVSQTVEAVGNLVVKQFAYPVDVHLGQRSG